MAGVVPDAAEVIQLANIVNKTAPQTWILCLYTNNKTPAAGDTEADYTEVVGNGYAAHSMTPASWVMTPGAPSTAAYPSHQFTFSGAVGNVYGYFCKQTTSGKIMFAERFSDGPYNVLGVGTPIDVQVTISEGSVLSD